MTKETSLAAICRSCRKISSAKNINLRSLFTDWDPSNSGIVSEQQFLKILSRQLARFVTLSECEIKDIADYFKIADGRIIYSQFCDIVEEQTVPQSKCEQLDACAEFSIGRYILTPQEERQLVAILKQIAGRLKNHRVLPCFFQQDYELVGKPKGIISNDHLLRVLTFIGVHLHEKDICILLKKFGRDLTTVRFDQLMNYVVQFMGQEGKPEPDYCEACKPPIEPPQPHKNVNEKIEEEFRTTLEKALDRIYKHINSRRINLQMFFCDFDKQKRTGHVTRSQMRRVVHSIGVLLTEREINSLELRYTVDANKGFDYHAFLHDLDRCIPAEALYPKLLCKKERVNSTYLVLRPTCDEKNLSRVLCKIRHCIQSRGTYVRQFFEQFDPRKTQKITVNNFKRGLDNCFLSISIAEIDTITDGFLVTTAAGETLVNYELFFRAVTEEPSKHLAHCPLCLPPIFCPGGDCWGQFLNFEERLIATDAIRRLAREPDLNLREVFRDQDKLNTGRVTLKQLQQALCRRNTCHIMSPCALEILCKAFRTNYDEMNYRAFLQALDIAVMSQT